MLDSKSKAHPTTRATLLLALIAPTTLLGAAGCRKELDPQEYGKIHYELPAIEGAEKPIPLPELEKRDEEDQNQK